MSQCQLPSSLDDKAITQAAHDYMETGKFEKRFQNRVHQIKAVTRTI
jgi:hypothetical protein